MCTIKLHNCVQRANNIYQFVIPNTIRKQFRYASKCHTYDTFTYSVRSFSMDLQEVGLGYEDWIGLAQDRDRWRVLLSAVRNLRVP